MTSKELREKRAALIAEARALNDKVLAEKRSMNPEEEEQWNRMNADIDALKRDIDRVERLDGLAAELESRSVFPGRDNYDGRQDAQQKEEVTTEDRALAMQAWCRARKGMDLESRHVDAARRVGVNLNGGELSLRFASRAPKTLGEARAMSALKGDAGGLLVFPEFVSTLETALLAYGGIRQAADVIRTSSGEDMSWPTSDDTSNKGAILAENAPVPEGDVKVAATKWGAHKYTSKMIKVPYELLQDSAFNMVEFLAGMLGERIGRITNEHFTTGDGAAKPWGIVSRATTGVTTKSATAITFDEIMGLIYSVDPAYRANGRFMLHDQVVLHLRTLKDGNGQYIWQTSILDGEPDRLLSYPVLPNVEMASAVAANATTVLFGDLSKYKIRDVGEFRLLRLIERYRDNDQDGFVAFSRHDGNLLDAGTHPVKALVQHA